MAIAIDITNAGETANNAASSSVAVTTTSAIAAGATIIVTGTSYNFGASTTATDNGPGLTWTRDVNGAPGTGGDSAAFSWIFSAYAAAGMASGTVITVTLSGSAAGRSAAVTSFTGILSASPLDTTTGPTGFLAPANTWSTTSTAISAGSLLIAIAFCINTNDTNTVTSPSLEAHDFGAGVGTFGAATCYRIEASAGSYTVAGTWSAAETGGLVAAAYKVAPPAVGVSVAWLTA